MASASASASGGAGALIQSGAGRLTVCRKPVKRKPVYW